MGTAAAEKRTTQQSAEQIPFGSLIMPRKSDLPITEIWRLYHVEKLSAEEIAKRIEVTGNTVSSRLRKAGYKLRTQREAEELHWQRQGPIECKYKSDICHGTFVPKSPRHFYCDACAPIAKKELSREHAAERYREDPLRGAATAKTNRWKRKTAAGEPVLPIGGMAKCKYRDEHGKRGKGCLGTFARKSSSESYCDNCKKLQRALIASKSRRKNIENVRTRDRRRRESVLKDLKELAALRATLAAPSAVRRVKRSEVEKAFYKIGSQVEALVSRNSKNSRKAIVVARQLITDKTHHQYDVVAQYHKAYRRHLRETGIDVA